MTHKIDEIIMKLINNGYKLIYRPHPLDLTKKGNQGLKDLNKKNIKNIIILKSISLLLI